MKWEQFVNRLQAPLAGTSVSLNMILILLIIKKSPEQLGSYRYLMIYIALFEIFYSILDVTISPTIFSHRSMYFVIVSTKDSIFSKNVLLILDAIWCGCFGTFMMLFCTQFFYRYLVVIGSNTLKSFNDYRLVFWILTPILVGVWWGLMSIIFGGPRESVNVVLRDLLLVKTDLTLDEITYLGPQCYYETEHGVVIDTDSIITLVAMMTVMSISLACILYFAIKTFTKIKNTLTASTMISTRYTGLQRQAFYALVTQAVIPVILLHFPCLITMLAAILDIDLGHTSGLITITFALFPALDPLPVMLIIKSYRATLWSVMSRSVYIFIRRQTRTTYLK